MCKASSIFKSNFQLALSVILKKKEGYASQNIFVVSFHTIIGFLQMILAWI